MIYVAIANKERKIEYAEHFEDEDEARKRFRQLAGECSGRGSTWAPYSGTEPIEAYFARFDAKEGQDVEALAKKAASTSKSVKGQPEVDDRHEARPLPEWAVAQHEEERVELLWKDAEASANAHDKKAADLEAFAAKIEIEMAGIFRPRKEKDAVKAAKAAALGARLEANEAATKAYRIKVELLNKQDEAKKLRPKTAKEAVNA